MGDRRFQAAAFLLALVLATSSATLYFYRGFILWRCHAQGSYGLADWLLVCIDTGAQL